MKKIKKLPPNLIAQIAAGEVIERPAYAVKELIDNAIDAHATEITISIEKSGIKKIIVADNGEGMSQEDLLESYKIHTTSKVEGSDSLTAIKSLGFRGEALSSMAAISNLIIKSRPKKKVSGFQIEVSQGKLINTFPVGIPEGTIVEIDNIFSSIPARKKFLRSSLTELRHIIEIVDSFALSYTEISFKLIHNKKILIDLPKTENLIDRINQVMGSAFVLNTVPLDFKDSYISLHGFIGKPQLSTKGTGKQFIYVNRRRVTDKLISQAIKQSFGNLLSSNHNPVFIIFVELPVELIDINVHPRKEQVSFYNQQNIFDAVIKATSETLNNFNLTFSNLPFAKDSITDSFAGKILKQNVNIWNENKKNEINYKKIIQFHNLYLVIETKGGIIFVDQHAAHERVLYEKFLKEFKTQFRNKKTFDLSETIDLSLKELQLLKEFLKEFQKNGFEFLFKQNKVLIKKAPLLFKDRIIKDLIRELLESFEEQMLEQKIDSLSEELIKYLACKNAVKRGDILTTRVSIDIIKQLEKTANNSTCPHGRPTKIEFNLKQIDLLFKR